MDEQRKNELRDEENRMKNKKPPKMHPPSTDWAPALLPILDSPHAMAVAAKNSVGDGVGGAVSLIPCESSTRRRLAAAARARSPRWCSAVVGRPEEEKEEEKEEEEEEEGPPWWAAVVLAVAP